ncbi:MAG: type II secretion system protein [Candidatus Omnitrophota bacterium]|nr:type II secretion system protein [Candidatus Omnitrophota bacterium]
MKYSKKNQRGFTLIELVMVIVILAVLGAVAIPIYVDLSGEANSAAEEGVVGGVRAGVATYFIDPARGNRTSYPSALGTATNAACSKTNACFATVLQQGGVTQGWTKTGALAYTGPNGGTYTFNTTTGAFS